MSDAPKPEPICSCGHRRDEHLFPQGCRRCGGDVCRSFKKRTIDEELALPDWING